LTFDRVGIESFRRPDSRSARGGYTYATTAKVARRRR
jgi:hypothetical protein